MKFSELVPRGRHNFTHFLLFFFFYYFIMSAYLPFSPIWLTDVNHLTKTEAGIVFPPISLFAIISQPMLGLMSDKLGLRKHLLWTTTVLLILFAPFFVFVFSPPLQAGIIAGTLAGGIYLGIVFSGSSGAAEAYIERVSQANHFECGEVWVTGYAGWALCVSITGVLFGIDPNITFWVVSGFALVLDLLLWSSQSGSSDSAEVIEALGTNRQALSLRTTAKLLYMPRFWGFIVYMIGVANIYDVSDQQFANFSKSFFTSPQRGTGVFGFVTIGDGLFSALIMPYAPAVVNRIGAKNALLTAGMIISVHILESSLASSTVEVVILKMPHMFEIPFLLAGTFGYISSTFNPQLSATLFPIGFNLSKQLSGAVLSARVGRMYDTVGLHQAYLILRCITLSFTLFLFFTLRGGKNLLPTTGTQTPA